MIIDKILKGKFTLIIIFPHYKEEDGYSIYLDEYCKDGKRSIWNKCIVDNTISNYNDPFDDYGYRHKKTKRECVQIMKKVIKDKVYKIPLTHPLYKLFVTCELFCKPNDN